MSSDFKQTYYRLTARLADEQPKGIAFMSEGWLRCLAYVYRYTTQPRLHQQNVPEHTFFTAILSYCIASDMQERGIDVNPELAATKAMFHDIEESLTGDIVLPMKYHSKEINEAVKDAGSEMLNDALLRDLGISLGRKIYDLWADAKDETLEGRVVAFCDVLEALGYNNEECTMGNKQAEIVVGNAKRLLSPYLKIVEFRPYISELLGIDCDALTGNSID